MRTQNLRSQLSSNPAITRCWPWHLPCSVLGRVGLGAPAPWEDEMLRGMVFVLALAVMSIGCAGDGGGEASGGTAGSGGSAGSGGTAGTGGGGGGTEVDSNETLGEMMDRVTPDLANVLGEIAPDPALAAQKQNGTEGTTNCPGGGTASYEPAPGIGTGGTIFLENCEIADVAFDGDLAGFLELDPEGIGMHRQVHATMLRSVTPIEISGIYRASLMVDRLDVSADFPDPDPYFIWYEIHARTPLLQTIIARSCDPDCQDPPL